MRDRRAFLLLTGLLGLLCIMAFASCSRINASQSTVEPAKVAQSAAELLALGEKYLLELDYEQAIVYFTKVIEIEPMNVRAYLGGTDAYLHLDKVSDAIGWLATGIEATDNNNLAHVLTGVEKSIIEGYIALAEAYEAEGWYEKALELLQRVYDETGDEIIGRKLGIVQASEMVFRDDYIIQWKDPAFESLIRKYLGKESADIHYDDVKLIEKITIWSQIIAMQDENFRTSYSENHFNLGDGREGAKDGEIRSLADLEHFTSLKSLTVNHQMDLDISALTNTDSIDCLLRLETLSLVADNISDISVVSELIALKSLSVAYNNVVDISPVSMLIELTSIQISNNKQIASAEPLRGLRKLSSVSLSRITKVDLNVFVGMPELRSMNLVGIESVDYSILMQLNLDYLEITCDDSVFQIVKQLASLTSLRLHGQGSWNNGAQTGGLTNITGISSLNSLTRLDLLAPNCHDIAAISSLKLERIEIDLPDDCDLTPLKSIASLSKVIVPRSNNSEAGENSLLERVRVLLPGIEVTTER